jgi:hypothetical protein
MQEHRIADALRLEGEWRSAVEGKTAGEITRIRNDMQEFVNRQLPSWIQEGIVSKLNNLPPPPSVLTMKQI